MYYSRRLNLNLCYELYIFKFYSRLLLLKANLMDWFLSVLTSSPFAFLLPSVQLYSNDFYNFL